MQRQMNQDVLIKRSASKLSVENLEKLRAVKHFALTCHFYPSSSTYGRARFASYFSFDGVCPMY